MREPLTVVPMTFAQDAEELRLDEALFDVLARCAAAVDVLRGERSGQDVHVIAHVDRRLQRVGRATDDRTFLGNVRSESRLRGREQDGRAALVAGLRAEQRDLDAGRLDCGAAVGGVGALGLVQRDFGEARELDAEVLGHVDLDLLVTDDQAEQFGFAVVGGDAVLQRDRARRGDRVQLDGATQEGDAAGLRDRLDLLAAVDGGRCHLGGERLGVDEPADRGIDLVVGAFLAHLAGLEADNGQRPGVDGAVEQVDVEGTGRADEQEFVFVSCGNRLSSQSRGGDRRDGSDGEEPEQGTGGHALTSEGGRA